MTILLFHLARAAIALAVFYPLVMLILRLCQPSAALLHRLAWGGVLLIPFFAMSLPFSISIPVAENALPIVESPAVPTFAETTLSESAPYAEFPTFHAETQSFSEEEIPVHTSVATVASPEIENSSIAAMITPDGIKQMVLFTLVAVWLGGIAVFLRKRYRMHRKLVRFFATQNPAESEELEPIRKVWQALLRDHGIPFGKIPLLTTESLGPALVRKGLRFYLLIPRTLSEELPCAESPSEGGPDEILRGILRHELAHYRNRDSFWTAFFRTLATLLWFHPLAWKALANYEMAAEWCCDEFAYLRPNQTGSAVLAKTFLVIHQNTESLALNVNTFARFQTVERVDRLVRSETRKEPLMKKLLILGLLGLLFFGGMLHIRLVAQSDKPNSPNAVVKETAKFPLTFQSEEDLSQFLETYTPSPESPAGKKGIDQQKLKMLVLAMHTYHDANKFFPSSSTAEDGTGKPMHSWRVALLPYLEQGEFPELGELYAKIRKDEPWDSEYNKQFHSQMPDCYRSPYLSDEQASQGLTNYVMIVGNLRGEPYSRSMGGMSSSGMGSMPMGGMMSSEMQQSPVNAIFAGPNSWSSMAHITDGTSNTILFAERSQPVCWMDPTGDVPIKIAVQGINAVPNGLGSIDGKEGINVAFADGSVSFAPSMSANAMLEAALTCNGGESLSWEPDKWKENGLVGEIQGIVTLDGKPLPHVAVLFVSNANPKIAFTFNTDINGQFQLNGKNVQGEYKVCIRSLSNAHVEIISRKYADPRTTPLSVTLQEGKNVIELNLESPSK